MVSACLELAFAEAQERKCQRNQRVLNLHADRYIHL